MGRRLAYYLPNMNLRDLKRGDWATFAAVAAIFVALIVGALMMPRFETPQGEYVAHIVETESYGAIEPAQRALVELPDARRFWVKIKASAAYNAGDDLYIRVFCQTKKFEDCKAVVWAPRSAAKPVR